jgi:hypothetical protein
MAFLRDSRSDGQRHIGATPQHQVNGWHRQVVRMGYVRNVWLVRESVLNHRGMTMTEAFSEPAPHDQAYESRLGASLTPSRPLTRGVLDTHFCRLGT